MNFIDAIKVCFIKYVDFNGCASKPEFWWWVLFTALGSTVLQAVNYSAAAAFSLATFLPTLAVTTRRLHDTDRSGWLQLLWLVPIMGWATLLILCASTGKPNRYGVAPQGPAAA